MSHEPKSLTAADTISGTRHEHCFHATRGALLIVLKDGYEHQTCCRCPETRTIHAGHANT